jgi:hypothetical protein
MMNVESVDEEFQIKTDCLRRKSADFIREKELIG